MPYCDVHFLSFAINLGRDPKFHRIEFVASNFHPHTLDRTRLARSIKRPPIHSWSAARAVDREQLAVKHALTRKRKGMPSPAFAWPKDPREAGQQFIHLRADFVSQDGTVPAFNCVVKPLR